MLKIKFGFSLILFLLINGCYPWIYKAEVQQGNIVEQKDLDLLKQGMNKEQVRFILGSPILKNNLNKNRWYYYFSLDDRENNKLEKYWLYLVFNQEAYQKYEIGEKIFDIEDTRSLKD